MPRKAKETKDEEVVKKPSKLNKKINELLKTVFEPEEKVTEKKVTKSEGAEKAPRKTSKTKTDKETTKKVEKETAKKATKVEKESAKRATKAEKETAKKATKVEKESAKKSTKAEKEETKKATTTKKEDAKKTKPETKRTTKKASTKKDVEEGKTVKKTTTRKTSTKKAKDAEDDETSTKSTKIVAPTKIEYYDLPYKYNQTVVKVLYQNPTTLFVYWEISDGDIENYKNMYGENFFETTRPALIVYNDTMNYHFEIGINDFANSWYFGINDSKCDYRVELIRRPIYFNEKIKENYIYITSSNKIETPNDRILFSTNEPYIVYFKNTKNNNLRKVNLPKLIEQLNLSNKNFGFPIVRNVEDLYKVVYRVDDEEEFSISLNNPSSGGNPSSHSLSSRFRY